MGAVQLVKNHAFPGGRLEARKLINVMMSGSEDAFREEIQRQADLRHPNIVTVYAVDKDETGLFFTMEYLSGGDLEARIRDRRSAPHTPRNARWHWQAAKMLIGVASAVEYMHGQGIFHRDLKPKNVLLTEDGWVKVADFGLAKFVRPRSDHSPDGAGTPVYMPPEVARARAGGAGASLSGDDFRRGDVYGLGVILYEMLVGEPPFRWEKGESEGDLLRRVAEGRIVPPRQRDRAVPRALERVCMKCLAKKPEDRYGSAAEVAQEMRRYLEAKPRRWLAWALAGVLLVSTLAAGGVAFKTYGDQSQAAAERQRVKAEREAKLEALFEAAVKERDDTAAINKLTEARALLEQHLLGEAPSRHCRERHFDVVYELARRWRNKRDYEAALDRLREARAMAVELPDGGRRAASVDLETGRVYRSRNENDKAWKHFDEYRKYWEMQPQNPEARRWLARAYGFRGDAELALGRYEDAAKTYARSLEIREGLYNDGGKDAVTTFEYARAITNVANLHEAKGGFDEALKRRLQSVGVMSEFNGDVPVEFQDDLADGLVALAQGTLLAGAVPDKPLTDRIGRAPVFDPFTKAQVDLALLRGRLARGENTPETLAELGGLLGRYDERQSEGLMIPSDLYPFAQAHALYAQLLADAKGPRHDPKRATYHQMVAIARLKDARVRKYQDGKKVQADPAFAPLRDHPVFQEAIASLNE
jgi:tetratricopeptide (TPR) repeat protein